MIHVWNKFNDKDVNKSSNGREEKKEKTLNTCTIFIISIIRKGEVKNEIEEGDSWKCLFWFSSAKSNMYENICFVSHMMLKKSLMALVDFSRPLFSSTLKYSIHIKVSTDEL